MGRLSRRTIQCRHARRQRDLKKLGLQGLTTTASPLQQEARSHKHNSSCSSSASATVKQRPVLASSTAVNFAALGVESLQRYQQTYGLGVTPGSSREELVVAVRFHFQRAQELDEGSVLSSLVHALQRDSSSSDVSCDSSTMG